MKLMCQPCGNRTPSDPVNAAFFWRSKADRLLKVDLDIVHPATGELPEAKEDADTGSGIVAIKRDEETPVTQLKIHAGSSLSSDSKVKLEFTNGDRYKIWKDAAMSEEVVSLTTELDATVEHTLYFEGLQESSSESGETVKQVYSVGSNTFHGDQVRFTVVEAEYDVDLRIFIPDEYVDLPLSLPFMPQSLYGDQVAAGDGRTFDSTLSQSYRASLAYTLIPFSELDSDGVKDDSLEAIPGVSIHYRESALPELVIMEEEVGRLEEVKVEYAPQYSTPEKIAVYSGLDGYEGIIADDLLIGWALPPFHFSSTLWLDRSDPLEVKYQVIGVRTQYPAFELYISNSTVTNKPIYRFLPPPERTPASLFNGPIDALGTNDHTPSLSGTIEADE